MSARVWLHNGHIYEPGQDIDNPLMADPRWCNTCGEVALCLYDGHVIGAEVVDA